MTRLALALLLLACGAPASMARVLTVGEGKAFPAPSAAAGAAQDGDTVLIDPGVYYDCAEWRANGLTIAATAPGVELTDRACAGKAAFVIRGNDTVIRGLSFARVRVEDQNGAGIRLEGRNLTVSDTDFTNNQFGILAGGAGGWLRIAGCLFRRNGISLEGRPTHAVSAGGLEELRIAASVFEQARGGDHVSSNAARTELVGNRFFDEGGAMAGPLAQINGGTIVLTGNTVTLAAGAAARPGAFLTIGRVASIRLAGNTLVAPDGAVPLLRNWSGTTVDAADNAVPAGGVAENSRWGLFHRLHALAGNIWRTTRDRLGWVKGKLVEGMRRVWSG